ANAPVVSDVPTLLLSGLFDIQTPARYADRVASTLSRAQKASVPLGHVAISRDPCPDQIIAQFLDHPLGTADLSCVNAMRVSFLLPSDFVPSKITSKLARPVFLSPSAPRHPRGR